MEISGIAVGTAFLAGVVSFLSPCVLPLVPAYASYIAGESLEELASGAERRARRAATVLSLLFVAGFSTVFVVLGAGATALGDLLRSHLDVLNKVAGIVIVLFGLVMIGMVRLAAMQRDLRFHLDSPGGRPAGAYVMGAAFAFGWTPCIGPVLGSILTVAAVSGTAEEGMALLALYAAGLGVPFVAAAAFTGTLLRHARRLGRTGRILQIVAGVLVLMGIAMITGELQAFAFWLLETFPGLANVEAWVQ